MSDTSPLVAKDPVAPYPDERGGSISEVPARGNGMAGGDAGGAPHYVDIPSRPTIPDEHTRKTDGFLYFCWCLSVVTGIAAVLCAVVNLLAAIHVFKSGTQRTTGENRIFLALLRCYGVAIALFVAIGELELEFLFRFFAILESWVWRGILALFVAIMTKALARSGNSSDGVIFFSFISSWLMLACGAFYLIAGLLCIGNIKRSFLRSNKDRTKALRDLEEVEKHRAELRRHLGHDVE